MGEIYGVVLALFGLGEIYGVVLALFGLLYYVGPFIVPLIAILSLFSALSGKRKDKFISLIISGVVFIIAGLFSLYLSTLSFNFMMESYQTNLFFSIYFAIMPFTCLIIGILLALIGIIRTFEFHKAEELIVQPRNNYKNREWLKMHYLDRGKTIQEIANHENVSMMEIEKAIRKIELSKDDKK